MNKKALLIWIIVVGWILLIKYTGNVIFLKIPIFLFYLMFISWLFVYTVFDEER